HAAESRGRRRATGAGKETPMSTPRNDRKPQGKPEDSSQQQQPQSGEGQQYGEGNYKATRDYAKGLKEHMEHHDIEREARDAAPRNASEEKAMEDAERAGRRKAKGHEPP